MGEYIERGALIAKLQEVANRKGIGAAIAGIIIQLIETIPSADVVAVKHGRWIPTEESNSTGPIVRCSACGQYINPSATAIELNRQKIEPAFCEKCGAIMDGG